MEVIYVACSYKGMHVPASVFLQGHRVIAISYGEYPGGNCKVGEGIALLEFPLGR